MLYIIYIYKSVTITHNNIYYARERNKMIIRHMTISYSTVDKDRACEDDDGNI